MYGIFIFHLVFEFSRLDDFSNTVILRRDNTCARCSSVAINDHVYEDYIRVRLALAGLEGRHY